MLEKDPPKTIMEMLLQSRMARYPLATILIVVSVAAFLWWLDPEFVRFLREATPPVPE